MQNLVMPDQIPDWYTLPSIINLDNLFITTPNTLVLNSLLLEKSSDEVIDTICDVSSDTEDSIAACECGELTGNYYEGTRCKVCGSVCESSLFNEIKNDIWLSIPNTITAVLNPQVYSILGTWLGSIAKIPVLEGILDMERTPEPIQGTPFFTGQGFNWFYDNFESIIDYFITSHPIRAKRTTGPHIRAFLTKSRNDIWCTKLPILSRVVQPITKHSNSVRYADPDLRFLMKAIFTLGSTLISEKMMRFTVNHVERNFYKVYARFIEYTNNILTEKLPKKPALLRKHVFGTRYHFTGRSVVIAMMGQHEADEVYLPWKLGIMMYKYHIISVLINHHGCTVFQANDRVMTAINVYDHTLDLIIQKLIQDCPTKGLPILMNRNPSLKIAAIQLVYVTKIKPALKVDPFIDVAIASNDESIISVDSDGFAAIYQLDDDPVRSNKSPKVDKTYSTVHDAVVRYVEDGTIEVSPLIIRGPNIDFDGDELNILLLCEADEVAKFHNVHPYNRIISSSELAIDGKDIGLSNQQLVGLNGFLNE
jgi:hypothetical protein